MYYMSCIVNYISYSIIIYLLIFLYISRFEGTIYGCVPPAIVLQPPPLLQLGDHIRCQQVHVDAILTLAGEVWRGSKGSPVVVEKAGWTTPNCHSCCSIASKWANLEWHSQAKVRSVPKFWGLVSIHKGESNTFCDHQNKKTTKTTKTIEQIPETSSRLDSSYG